MDSRGRGASAAQNRAADAARWEDSRRWTFDTSVDLAGNPGAERLTVNEHSVLVSNGRAALPRAWRFDQTERFRVEPSTGSCFLQARQGGEWIDVLRCPGNADRGLSELADRLNARGRSGAGGPQDERAGGEERRAPSRWFSLSNRGSRPVRRLHAAARLASMLRPFHGSVLLLLALSLAAVAIDVAPPMLQGMLVDRVLGANPSRTSLPQLLQLLLAIVASLLLIRLTATVIAVWKGRVSSRVGAAMTANLRNELVRKLNELPLEFHSRSQVGVLMSQVAYDTETMHTLVHHMTSGFLLQSLQLAGIAVMLFYLNPTLALITILPMPLIVAGSWYFLRYLHPLNQHYWEAVGRQAAALMGMLSGIRLVKAFVQEEHEIDRFQASSNQLRDSRLTVDISTATFTAAMGLLFALGGLVVWYVGGRNVLSGTMTLGSLVAFLAYLAMFYTPLTSIAESTTWLASFYGTSQRIHHLLETPSETAQGEPDLPAARIRGGLEFEHVSFGYEKNRPVLEDVSLAVAPGEIVGVMGRSGSGKSTLVSLIGRLYEVDSGRILVDGVDVRQMPPRQLRRQIGMVPQDPFLFRGAVAANISYGRPHAAPEQIIAAAKQADAHDFILRMPLAYQTLLGEGGTGLSGGERQRMSIARAILFDPVILILDEATASVDAESERAICTAIRRGARRRTTIVVAHRLSTLRDAHRLLVFDQGRLVEQGTAAELLAQGGLYSALASLQGNLTESRRQFASAVGRGRLAGVEPVAVASEEHEFFPNGQSMLGEGCDSAEELSDEDAGARNGLDWLDPAAVTCQDDEQGRLRVCIGGRWHKGVQAVWAFPADEDRFICLRCPDASGRERELGLIRSLDAWPRAAQEALRRARARRYLFRPIREVRQVRASGNQLIVSVFTDGGPAKLRLDKPTDRCQPFGDQGLLLTDAEGAYYVISDRASLPPRQRRLVALYFGD